MRHDFDTITILASVVLYCTIVLKKYDETMYLGTVCDAEVKTTSKIWSYLFITGTIFGFKNRPRDHAIFVAAEAFDHD